MEIINVSYLSLKDTKYISLCLRKKVTVIKEITLMIKSL